MKNKKTEKSCGNCANCFKYRNSKGEETWSGDEYGFYYVGMPVDVTPPNDEACDLWTGDSKEANSWTNYV